MIKRKRVYICDHCGAVALELTYYAMGDSWKDAPEGWRKLGKEDLCPVCSETYEKFKAEVVKENDNNDKT
nr:MAG TPA: rubredoxin transport protein [Caudoviricetes sp.]